MRYWPKILAYGNWGGPGWSSGKFTNNPEEVDWSVEPVDAMDQLFKEHDWDIQHNLGRLAHKILAKKLEELDPPENWGYWPRLYRLAAIGIFSIIGFGA